MPYEIARTLEDAYNALDPQHPVTPEQIDTIFVERPDTPTESMRTQLRIARRSQKLLFVGHRGAGKSSELAYLSSLLAKDQFHCVPVPLYDIFQSPAVSHSEVVLALDLRLLQLATDEDVLPRGVVNEMWQGFLGDIYSQLKRWLFGESPAAGSSAPMTAALTLKKFATEVEAKIGTEPATRSRIREGLELRVNELIQQVNDIALQLQSKMDRRLLALVEDLDKFNRQETCDLFLQHPKTLTAPAISVVYSFPVAMCYSNDFPEIQKGFDGYYTLPNIALRHRNGSGNTPGLEKCVEIVARRVDKGLFDKGVLDKAVEMSGGHVKTVIQLAQHAVLNAIVAKNGVVKEADLGKAVRNLRDDYVKLLSKEQIELLRAIRKDPTKDLADIREMKQQLLYNGSLLEYGNTRGPWGDVLPIVEEILDRKDD